MRPVQNESKIPVGTLLIGKYKVVREIGRGGMAAVYEAEQIALGKRVAIKVLAAELSGSTIVIERFFREARAAASVKSPYIVDVYDSGRLEDGRPFITMEMLEGESLYDRMARVRLIDIPTTVRVISHCAKGLMKAHHAGIVHRDLKPENIFITKGEEGDEICKLLDFGLAKFYAPVAADEKTARLTREGAVFGTPAYMSPEQVKGQGNVDHRADLWGLGCMAFECLIGRPVWNTDQGVAMTFAAIATQAVPTPSKIRPDLPLAFDDWFIKALQRDPDKRFQSAKELSDSLTRALGQSATVSLINVSDIEDIESNLAPRAPLAESSNPEVAPISLRLEAATATPSPSKPETSPVVPPTAADLPPTELRSKESRRPPPKPSPVRWAFSIVLFVGGVSTAYYVYHTMLSPQVFTEVVASSASAAPTATDSSAAPNAPADDPKWAQALADGQKLFVQGDSAGAQKKFKEVGDLGAPAVSKTFIEQTKAAAAGTGPCKMVMFSHPHISQNAVNLGRPTIASSLRGPIVAWTDDHEQPNHDHVYSVILDEFGHPTSGVRDLTPEAADAMRPSLLSAGDRTVLLYWDRVSREAGVRARWLDESGHIAGASTLVSAGRPGNFWPSIEKSPEGYVVVWQDDRDKEGDDLFMRKLTPELDPAGPEIRLTDYTPQNGTKSINVRVPTVAVASNAIFVSYKLERDSFHWVERLRIPLTSIDLAKGLDEQTAAIGKIKKDRMLGDVKHVNEDKVPGDAPSIACGTEGCFIVWNGEQNGAFAALVEPSQGKVIWHKKFAPNGSRPSLGVSAEGQVLVAFYEKGLIHAGVLTRDGVGPTSTFAKIATDTTRPTIAAGKKGEWYLAWQDTEGGHTEAFVGKLACTP